MASTWRACDGMRSRPAKRWSSSEPIGWSNFRTSSRHGYISTKSHEVLAVRTESNYWSAETARGGLAHRGGGAKSGGAVPGGRRAGHAHVYPPAGGGDQLHAGGVSAERLHEPHLRTASGMPPGVADGELRPGRG